MRLKAQTLVAAIAACGFAFAHAGAYEDFFTALRTDDVQRTYHLLERGFDPNTLDEKLRPALVDAIEEGSLNVAALLIDVRKLKFELTNANGETALMMAALKGHESLVKAMIAKGAQVNQTGWTALHYAASGGHVKIVRTLLEVHAYIDAESPNGSTPLMMAARYGNSETVKMLLQQGADPTLKNQLGLTAMDFAKGVDQTESAKLIGEAISIWGKK